MNYQVIVTAFEFEYSFNHHIKLVEISNSEL